MESTDAQRSDDEVAYLTNLKAFCGKLSRPEIVQHYNSWGSSGQYDEHLNTVRYTGPECTARALADCYHDNKDRSVAMVLDVAAGTGRIGAELHKLGFRKVTALDPSEGMLSRAKARGVYSDFINSFFGVDYPLHCPDGTYDGLTCSGGFGDGHIPSAAILEMVRVVKPGGFIIIAMREEYIDQVEEYRTNFYPLISNLEKDGRMRVISKDVIPNYAFQKTGILFKFKVL